MTYQPSFEDMLYLTRENPNLFSNPGNLAEVAQNYGGSDAVSVITRESASAAAYQDYLERGGDVLTESPVPIPPEVQPTPPFEQGSEVSEASQECPCKKENIIVLGSEQYYNSFWLKMMFMSPAFSVAAGYKLPPRWKAADRTTVLYVRHGYVRPEFLALEALRDTHGINLVPLNSVGQLTAYVNNRMHEGEEYKVQHLVFLAHGLYDRLALNFWKTPLIDVRKRNIDAFNASAFDRGGAIYSYACRTGTWVDQEAFSSAAQAEPQNSIAQYMADQCGVKVYAFMTRTLFKQCIRDPADSDSITVSLVERRESQEGQIINISSEHEGLPHPGVGHSVFVLDAPIDPPGPFGGGQREGTAEYALWRKGGARYLPVGGQTPTGLPNSMRVFEPA
ncbi:hypothetical protein BDE40_1518 [Litoreibacter halocynthiae]|uniref:Uncharacterized protein n=1 Tax=Litoreibacter halocynthiae TaxID=1242689 RepID=A0A4R7LK76_9RHOB|nr:hypothetical protein [Litoreibacter halocynthiae]TDT74801.1 hypothetical protein BDE40_1518 [Litoreibacter halocynthiae]